MNGRKSIHTRQRKAPLRGARLCYRTEHAVQRRQPHGDNMMQGGSSRFWRVVQLIHAACMRAGTCATAAGARRAWLSRQEQQEDELRTREADGRSWLFLASFLGELLRVDMNGSDVWGHLGRRNWRFFASKTQKFLRGAPPRTPLGLAPQTPPLWEDPRHPPALADSPGPKQGAWGVAFLAYLLLVRRG